MKRLLLLLVVLAILATVTGGYLLSDPGYVVFLHGTTQVQMSLAFFLVAAVLAAGSLVLLTLLLSALWDLVSPYQMRGRWGRFVARRRLLAGFHSLVAGKWKQAERMLGSAAADPDWAVPAHLGAALAAEKLENHRAMLSHLEQAGDARKGALPAGLLGAWYALRSGYPVSARDQLQNLRDRYGDNPLLLQLLADAMAREQEWRHLVGLLPRLRSVVTDAEYVSLERIAWHGLMKHEAGTLTNVPKDQAQNQIHRIWKDMPGHLQRDPGLCAQYAGYLAQFGEGEAALKLVRKALEKGWDDRLPAVLECIENVAPERLLAQLEKWIAERPDNAVLQLTAGRVALRSQLWGKARSFFDTATRMGNQVALAEQARLAAAMGDNTRAAALLEQRLQQLSQTLPALPLPGARSSFQD